jgi:glycosyltransferase involved in cell wall biosynthesis
MHKFRPRHLLHVFPTFAVGGSQIRFGQLVASHGDRYRHTVIALDRNTAMAARLPSGAVALEPSVFARRSLIEDVRQAVQSLDKFGPDVLVTYNWGTMEWWLARKLRPRLAHVHIEDGFGPEERQQQFRRRILLRRLLLSDSSTTTVLPSKILLNIASHDWRLGSDRMQYVPNGVEWKRFACVQPSVSSNRIVIGTVAALRREKNIGRLIELFDQACGQRPGLTLELLIVGGGTELEKLKEKAQQSPYGSNITFTGASSEPELHLKSMDVFALTSDTEQMPLSVLEAMASSLPIVSFDVGDVAQMVSKMNTKAASTPRNDDAAFVQSLLEFIDDVTLRQTVGSQNLSVVKQHFTLEAMAASYAALFG